MWSLDDSMEGLLSGKAGSSTLSARTTLKGHSATVEDVVFKPASTELLVSVGDDAAMLMW